MFPRIFPAIFPTIFPTILMLKQKVFIAKHPQSNLKLDLSAPVRMQQASPKTSILILAQERVKRQPKRQLESNFRLKFFGKVW